MNCKQFVSKIVEALYAELTPEIKQEFDAHIATCSNCRTRYKQMQETLNFMSRRKRKEPDKTTWDDSWTVIQRKIESEPPQNEPIPAEKRFKWHPARVPAWAYGIAAMFLVVAGIFIGRTFWSAKTTVQVGGNRSTFSELSAEDSVTTQALVYLGKSKNLLLGVMNVNDESYSVITLIKQQQISRRLLQQAGYFKNALDKPDQQQLKRLIHDLEIILMQLANIEIKPGVAAVEMVKRGVDQKSILFKINVEEIRSAVRESAPDKSENNKL